MSKKLFFYYLSQTFETSLMGQLNWLTSFFLAITIQNGLAIVFVLFAYTLAMIAGFRREIRKLDAKQKEKENLKTALQKKLDNIK